MLEKPSAGDAWHLTPNQQIVRKDLHKLYGGSGQGGICPSAQSPNVLIFTDPSGEQFGYYDGWMDDGHFHYTGEGQVGDQVMTKGNAALLHHAQQGRALRVFQGSRGTVTYTGEFVLAHDDAWYETDAPERDNVAVLRKVLKFRLKPLDLDAQPVETRLAHLLQETKHVVESVPLEQHLTEKAFVNPKREPYEAERRESALVRDFSKYLAERQLSVERQKIVPEGEHQPLFTDIYVKQRNMVVEAKGSVTRENIRMAIGQVADYSRFLPAGVTRAILVPTKPRPDLLKLTESQGVIVYWQEGNSFHSSSPAHEL